MMNASGLSTLNEDRIASASLLTEPRTVRAYCTQKLSPIATSRNHQNARTSSHEHAAKIRMPARLPTMLRV